MALAMQALFPLEAKLAAFSNIILIKYSQAIGPLKVKCLRCY